MAEVVAEYDDGSSTESETYEFEDAFALGDADEDHLHRPVPTIEPSVDPQPLAPSPAPPAANCINILDLQASVLGDVATPQNETPAVHPPADEALGRVVRRSFPAIAERAVPEQLQVPTPAPLPVTPQYTAPRTRNAEKRDANAVRATVTRPHRAKAPVVVDITDQEVTDHYIIPRREIPTPGKAVAEHYIIPRRKIPTPGQEVADHYTIPRRKIPPIGATGAVTAPRRLAIDAGVARATRKGIRWGATPSAALAPPLPTAAAGGVAASHGQARVAGGATPFAGAIGRRESAIVYNAYCGHVMNEPTDIQAATTYDCTCCLQVGLPSSMFSKKQRKVRKAATRKCMDCTLHLSGKKALKKARKEKECEARNQQHSQKQESKPTVRAAAVKARAQWKAKSPGKRVLEAQSWLPIDSAKRKKGECNSGRRVEDPDEQQRRVERRRERKAETWALTKELVTRLGASSEVLDRRAAEAARGNPAAKTGTENSRLERSRDLIARTMNLPPPLPRSPPPSYYCDW